MTSDAQIPEIEQSTWIPFEPGSSPFDGYPSYFPMNKRSARQFFADVPLFFSHGSRIQLKPFCRPVSLFRFIDLNVDSNWFEVRVPELDGYSSDYRLYRCPRHGFETTAAAFIYQSLPCQFFSDARQRHHGRHLFFLLHLMLDLLFASMEWQESAVPRWVL